MSDPVPAGPEVSPAPSLASRAAAIVRTGLAAITFRRILIALIVVVVGALLFAYAPFPPFSTSGNIFVSSPEVYTRERLVNDRYDQDYWYRANLAALDDATGLLSGSRSTGLEARFAAAPAADGDESTGGAGAGGGGTEGQVAPDVTAPTGIPFDVAFDVRSGLRDTIRQLILENMLDDRHDLTGNSIYGLKFDTTVIPGDNTHGRASVQVTATIPHPFPSSRAVGEDVLPEVVQLVFGSPSSVLIDHPEPEIRGSYALYKAWLSSVTSRLDSYASRVYAEAAAVDSTCSAPPDVDQVTVDALASVLGIEVAKGTVAAADGSLEMPAPWRKFLRIRRLGGSSCADVPKFDAFDFYDMVYVFDSDAVVKENYVPAGIETGKWTAMLFNVGNSAGELVNYKISAKLMEEALKNGKGFQTCLETGDVKCSNAYTVPVPSGFFNFVQETSKSDAYVYALLPKSEVRAISTSNSMAVDAEANAGTSGWLEGLLRYGQKYSGTETESIQVGYGDGQSRATENDLSNEVRFGWVIGPVSTAAQGTQLVLLSVPAWSDELTLSVSIGWLDRWGNHRASRPPFTMTVKLPPDYEAFDSFIAGPRARPAPRILEEFMDIGELRACRPARILIPGSRLWRSANVTLGAQQATRITVLPSMQGIIAEFDSVDIPNDAVSAGSTRLRVWTSEGESSASKRITIRATEQEMAAGVCANATAGEQSAPSEVVAAVQ